MNYDVESRLPYLKPEEMNEEQRKFYDFHLALLDLTETKVLYEQTKFNHLNQKLTLARLAGLEDFPGENFEHLAIRVKGK